MGYEVIKQLAKQNGMTLTDVASIANVPYDTLHKIVSGITKAPPYKTMFNVAHALGMSADQFSIAIGLAKESDGPGATAPLPTPAGQRIGRAYDRAIPPVKRTVDVALEPYMDDKAASMGTAVRPDMEAADIEVDMTELPVYDQPAAAGYGNYLDDDIYEMISFPSSDVPRGTDYCVRISGDSMEPEIEDGDIVYVREALTLDNGDIGIFRLDNEAYCKKFTIDHRRREVRLVSVNEGYEDIPIEGDVDFRIIGRVLGVAEQ